MGRRRKEVPYGAQAIFERYLDRTISFNDALEATGLKKGVFYRMLYEYQDSIDDYRTHRDVFLGNNHGLTRKEYLREYGKEHR